MNTNGYDHDDDDPTDLADERAELAVLGSILLESGNNMWQADFLNPVDFYVSLHATMFAKMRDLYEQEVGMDASTVAGNDARLNILCIDAQNSIFTSMNLVHHATRVLKLSQKRQAVNSLDHMAQMLFDDNTTIEQVADYMVEAGESHRPVAKTATQFDAWREEIITAPQAAQTDKVERKYIVEDFIREGSLSIVYGDPGSLKSAICMDMLMCVANGDEWLKPYPFKGSEQRSFETECSRVLWLNYDQAHEDVLERLGAMARTYRDHRGDLGGENFDALSFGHPSVTLTNEQQARELGRFLGSESYRMVVVDSLLDVKGKVELIEEGIGEVLRMWRFVAEESKCAVVIIAHTTKNTGTLYGSQFIKAKLDHLYKIERPAGTDVVCIDPEKQRSFGVTEKLYARWTYQHFDGNRTLETCRFWGDGAEGRKAVAVANDNDSRILQVLKVDSPGRTFSSSDLAKLLGMTVDAVRAAMRRLEDDNVHFIVKGPMNQKFYYYGDEPISDDE